MAIDPIALALSKCNPNAPLEPDDERFVDFDSIRGFTLRQRLSRLLAAAGANPDQYVHAAVAGHRGSGKSTELNRAFAELRDANYLVLGASVNENLDPHDISFSDVMRLIVLLLDDAFAEDARKNDSIAKAFAVVRDWFRDVTRASETAINNATEMSAKAALGGKAGLEAGLNVGVGGKARTDLGELIAAIGVVRRSQSSESTQVKETIERYNNELVGNINLLLRAVKIGAPEKFGQGLVLILDNIDKYEPQTVNRAILRHAGLFQELQAHFVFTVQSALLHSPVEESVSDRFTTIELPMLPVFEPRSRNPRQAVVERLREAVHKRVPAELFDAENRAVDRLILASGGCWRDLLRLLEAALLDTGSVIGEQQVSRAVREVGQTFHRLIQNKAQIEILARTHLEHSVLSDEATRFLLYHRCILVYNGSGWYDSHPLLEGFAPYDDEVGRLRKAK